MRATTLYRYPVKGLSPECLNVLILSPGEYVPGDRLFAIENGPSGYDGEWPDQPAKIRFLMLMRQERLAELQTHWDEPSGILTVRHRGETVASGDLRKQEGRDAIARFLESFIGADMRGPARVLEAPAGRRFTDSRGGHVSIINLASIRALEEKLGVPVDPLRFRGNIHVEGLVPFAEFDLIGRVLSRPGGLRLKVMRRIQRCAATNVDPATGSRDLEIPQTLMQTYGHADCGVYATVLSGGPIRAGDNLLIEEPDQASLALV
jgi:uncharacterized protein